MIQCLACEVRLETSSYFKFGSAPDRIGSTSRAVISENGLTQKSPCQHTRRNLRQIRGHKTTISMTVHLTRRLPIFHRPSYAPPTTTASFVHRVSGKYLPSFGTLGPMAVLSLSEMMSLHHGELSNQLKMRLRMSMFLSGRNVRFPHLLRSLKPSVLGPRRQIQSLHVWRLLSTQSRNAYLLHQILVLEQATCFSPRTSEAGCVVVHRYLFISYIVMSQLTRIVLLLVPSFPRSQQVPSPRGGDI